MEAQNSAAGSPESQRTIITYSLLTGLTPLIPVPFVDDLARDYFRARMVRELAASRGMELDTPTIEILTRQPGGCCLGGCLASAFIFPFRLLFRTLFFFLEWKRAVDLTSASYHYGFLVSVAVDEGLLRPGAPGRPSPAAVRQAIDQVCREAPIKPVESAIGAALRQSRSILSGAAGLLGRSLARGNRRDPRAVADAVAAVEAQEKEQLGGAVDLVQQAVKRIPEEHFRRLRERLRALLTVPPT